MEHEQRNPDLEPILKILSATRMVTTSYKWHLRNRAAAPLSDISGRTGETRLAEAAGHATAAATLLDQAIEILNTAIGLVDVAEPVER